MQVAAPGVYFGAPISYLVIQELLGKNNSMGYVSLFIIFDVF
jgi:hypothetical protein